MIKKLLVVLMLSVFMLEGYAQKVAGYFPSYRSSYLNTVQWDKLTDCYFAFINADANGNLITTNPSDEVFGFDMTTFLNVKSKCTANNVKLHISVGGADRYYKRAERLKIIAANATARANFATKIVQFAIDNNLSGINIDWEFPNASIGQIGGTVDNHYDLINAVRTAINSSTNKSLTLGVAVGGEYAGTVNHLNYIKSTVVSLIDEFHIMAYDLPKDGTLPYDANHHASITDANKCLEKWNSTYSIPYNKMVLGVPFYGRRADRTTDDLASMYNNFSNTNASAAFNDADGVFTSGSNTWYYDSKVTLETKIQNAVSSKGCLGVFAWDLGQDRGDQYSLLAVMRAKMNTICPIPDPNLGPDKGFCTGNVILDPNVPVASSRTFTWQKDNVDIPGYVNSSSANTYTATAGGVYKVIINQGSGCSKTATIKVISGSSVTGNDASRCGTGTVTLTLNNTTGTFDWYDAPTGGSKLLTGGSGNNYGRSYSPNVTVTKDFYVQENTGSQDYSAGRTTVSNTPNSAWNDAGQNDDNKKPRFAQKLTAYTDLTLKSIRVFTSTIALTGVKIVVYQSDGSTVQGETTPISIVANAGSQLITVNITLPGSASGTDYYVGVYGSNATGGTNAGFSLDRNANATDFTQSGVYKIEKACYISYAGNFGMTGSLTTNYGQLFDWTITTGVAAPCGRTKVTATVNNAPAAPGTISGDAIVSKGQTEVSYSVTEVSGATSYSWSYSGEGATFLNSSSSAPKINFSSTATSGDITVKAVNACGESAASPLKNVQVTGTTSIFEMSAANGFNVYPNPLNDASVITISVNREITGKLVITDLYGTILAIVQNENLNAGANTITLPALNAGMYLLKLESEGKVYTHKIVQNK